MTFDTTDETLKRYLEDIRKTSPIDRKDEHMLFKLCRQGNRAAREKLVSANMRFVLKVALQYRGCPIPLPDLVSEGAMGLIRAIESFDRGLIVILGGKYKGGDFAELAEPLRARGAQVVAIGEARPRIHAALDRVVAVTDAASMADAVQTAALKAPEGGTVLLAPACSSFDMFGDYAERGRAFVDAVKTWEGTVAM